MNKKETHERYEATVNALWPTSREELPKPMGTEAITGCRLLLREGFRFYGLIAQAKKKRTFKLTSGNRHTWPRGGVWYVNPDKDSRGWAEIVHSVGHWCHHVRYPKLSGHDISHAAIERHLIRFAIERGFLEGKLKRPEKEQKPQPDARVVKLAAIEAKEKRWATKAKRAATALKKLQRQRHYIERCMTKAPDKAKAPAPFLEPGPIMRWEKMRFSAGASAESMRGLRPLPQAFRLSTGPQPKTVHRARGHSC